MRRASATGIEPYARSQHAATSSLRRRGTGKSGEWVRLKCAGLGRAGLPWARRATPSARATRLPRHHRHPTAPRTARLPAACPAGARPPGRAGPGRRPAPGCMHPRPSRLRARLRGPQRAPPAPRPAPGPARRESRPPCSAPAGAAGSGPSPGPRGPTPAAAGCKVGGVGTGGHQTAPLGAATRARPTRPFHHTHNPLRTGRLCSRAPAGWRRARTQRRRRRPHQAGPPSPGPRLGSCKREGGQGVGGAGASAGVAGPPVAPARARPLQRARATPSSCLAVGDSPNRGGRLGSSVSLSCGGGSRAGVGRRRRRGRAGQVAMRAAPRIPPPAPLDLELVQRFAGASIVLFGRLGLGIGTGGGSGVGRGRRRPMAAVAVCRAAAWRRSRARGGHPILSIPSSTPGQPCPPALNASSRRVASASGIARAAGPAASASGAGGQLPRLAG